MIKYSAILYSFGKAIKEAFPKAILRCEKNNEDIKDTEVLMNFFEGKIIYNQRQEVSL